MNSRQQTEYRKILCRILADQGNRMAVDVYGELFMAADLEGMGGIFSILMLERSEVTIEEEVRGYLRDELQEQAAWSLRIRHAARQIFEALNGAGIDFICMRGLAVAEGLYGERASLRPISDVDLVLARERMLDAKQALWDIGFRPDPKYRNIYSRGDIHIDLHHEPIGIERIRAWEHITPLRAEDMFKYSETGRIAGKDVLRLQPYVELPYLCFHAMKHSFDRLIWLYDIALLANRISESDQWDEVRSGIEEYRLQRPAYYALAYVREHLRAAVPEDLLAAIRPEMNWVESSLFRRHMRHEKIPFLAERIFARMQPDFSHRIEFWRETIYPRYEVREQMINSGCVKCNFIRKRLKQLAGAGWTFVKEGIALVR